MAPFLAELLDDPYSVVRYIAHRSLTRLPGFNGFEYDYTGSEQSLSESVDRAREHWQNIDSRTNETLSSQVLIGEDGLVMQELVRSIMSRRDDKPVDLLE